MAWDLNQQLAHLHPALASPFQKQFPLSEKQTFSITRLLRGFFPKATSQPQSAAPYQWPLSVWVTTSSVFVAALSLWALSPSLSSLFYSPNGQKSLKMFTKRPDKYAAGFINNRNDCFANSSLQAYSSLPSFTEYLNNMLAVYHHTMELVNQLDIDLDSVVDLQEIRAFSHSKFNASKFGEEAKSGRDYFKIKLHVAMAKIVSKLNNVEMLTKNLSVWTFLHEIEKIYYARISKSQHDAHELSQLINETLETENIICKRVRNLIVENLSRIPATAPYTSQLQEFPEFPICGLVLLQMKCLTCAYVSLTRILSFLMLTLHPPQELTTDLHTLLEKNGLETITEYNWLKCRLDKIVANENYMKERGHVNPAQEEDIVAKLISYHSKPHLFINEDLPDELEQYVKSYNKGGLDIQGVKSSVLRETHILKPPNIFAIHFSRSGFNGGTLTRNPCRVSFDDKLSFSINDNYLEDLQKLQLQSNLEPQIVQSKTAVLTTDANDMESFSDTLSGLKFQDEVVNEREQDLVRTTSSEIDELLEQLADNLFPASVTSIIPSVDTSVSLSKPKTLNNAPISEGQTKNLIKHFGHFKFNENNVYKYRLRALIRHNGLHIQGHYECYKRKPLFVKNSEGTIYKLAPESEEHMVEEVEGLEARAATSADKASAPTSKKSDEPNSLLRDKLSSIISRQPSIEQGTPTDSNLQEIIDLGVATPAEMPLDQKEYFRLPTAQDVEKLFDKFSKRSFNNPTPAQKQCVKMKKIPSLIRYPYWRIGDSHVQEVSNSAVMSEMATAYLLYYERVDRK